MRQGWEGGGFCNPDAELVEGEGTLLARYRPRIKDLGEEPEGSFAAFGCFWTFGFLARNFGKKFQ
jgi:hypothetical protein